MIRPPAPHQYVDRTSGEVLTESLFGDRIVNLLDSEARERAPAVFRALTGKRMSSLLGWASFDAPLAPRLLGNGRFLAKTGVDLSECVEPPEHFTTPRRIFERRIRDCDCRPIPPDPAAADSRVVAGSFEESAGVCAKGKFFDLTELLGEDKPGWRDAFSGGDFAVFRLTPEKYPYNHRPVSGTVVSGYAVSGEYHSCHPGAVVEVVTPYSKNKRHVAILDTDVPGGTGVGLVAMIEVVALMIGEIVQCYSEQGYERPRPLERGMFAARGQPKSLYRPGSSTDILLFQPGRVRFEDELMRNRSHAAASSRFSLAFGQPLVETEVAVRSAIARRTEEDS